jgi:hypothetical protein
MAERTGAKRSRKPEVVSQPTEEGFLPLPGSPGADTPEQLTTNLKKYWQAMEDKYPETPPQERFVALRRIGRFIRHELCYGGMGTVMGTGIGFMETGLFTGPLSPENPGPLIGGLVGAFLGNMLERGLDTAVSQAEQTDPRRTQTSQAHPTRRG